MLKLGIATTLIVASFLTLSAVTLGEQTYEFEPFGQKVVYDVLDGRGHSRAKVDVIEWQGNLELHIYPKGMLSGLALKLDKTDKKKPVMVVGYRFTTNRNVQFVRRAILGISLREGFKVYEDKSADDEYTKIVISNNELQGDVVAFALDRELVDSYPAGHPSSKALAQANKPKNSEATRLPARAKSNQKKVQVTQESEEPAEEERVDNNGSLKHFSF